MSEVYASYSIKVKNAKGGADKKTAQKIYDYCKEHFDWFAEWGNGPFYIEDNVIYSDAEFGIKSAGDLLDDPIAWLRTVCEEIKPKQMEISISTDASECGGWYMQKRITAHVENGKLRVDNDLEYDYIEEDEPLLFADCDELEDFRPGRSSDSLCDNLVAQNCGTFDVDVVSLVFKDGEGEEITEPIRINPNGYDDVQEAIEMGGYYLEQGWDASLKNADGEPVMRLADIDVESVIRTERESYGDKSIEFLGLKLPGVEKPIMLKAWGKTDEETAEKMEFSEPVFGTFTDPRDGQVYKVIKIGNQEWLAENFAYECEGSCAYDNDENNVKKYGRLYTWEAAMKCAPEGWHLPTQEELGQLERWVVAHTDGSVGTALKSTDWKKPKGTDKFGFCALPAGFRNDRGIFYNLGYCAFFWSASEDDSDYAFCRNLLYNDEDFNEYWDFKKYAISVRLVKDEK